MPQWHIAPPHSVLLPFSESLEPQHVAIFLRTQCCVFLLLSCQETGREKTASDPFFSFPPETHKQESGLCFLLKSQMIGQQIDCQNHLCLSMQFLLFLLLLSFPGNLQVLLVGVTHDRRMSQTLSIAFNAVSCRSAGDQTMHSFGPSDLQLLQCLHFMTFSCSHSAPSSNPCNTKPQTTNHDKTRWTRQDNDGWKNLKLMI